MAGTSIGFTAATGLAAGGSTAATGLAAGGSTAATGLAAGGSTAASGGVVASGDGITTASATFGGGGFGFSPPLKAATTPTASATAVVAATRIFVERLVCGSSSS